MREASAKGLGDEAWGLRGGEPSETEFVEIGWRRGNVVLKVDVFCTQCSAVIEEVTLDWARAIDAEAQRGT